VKTTIVASLIDSCPGCRRPHAVHPVAKISKVKDLALIFIDKCILYFISCQKNTFNNRFATLVYSLTTI